MFMLALICLAVGVSLPLPVSSHSLVDTVFFS